MSQEKKKSPKKSLTQQVKVPPQGPLSKREHMALCFLTSIIENDSYSGTYHSLAEEAVEITDTLLWCLHKSKTPSASA